MLKTNSAPLPSAPSLEPLELARRNLEALSSSERRLLLRELLTAHPEERITGATEAVVHAEPVRTVEPPPPPAMPTQQPPAYVTLEQLVEPPVAASWWRRCAAAALDRALLRALIARAGKIFASVYNASFRCGALFPLARPPARPSPTAAARCVVISKQFVSHATDALCGCETIQLTAKDWLMLRGALTFLWLDVAQRRLHRLSVVRRRLQPMDWLCTLALTATYHAFALAFLGNPEGQTPGKRLFNIRVISGVIPPPYATICPFGAIQSIGS
eukprot:SAG11_NODE_5876_length_1443_cov_1.108631_1_plen_273_part_00